MIRPVLKYVQKVVVKIIALNSLQGNVENNVLKARLWIQSNGVSASTLNSEIQCFVRHNQVQPKKTHRSATLKDLAYLSLLSLRWLELCLAKINHGSYWLKILTTHHMLSSMRKPSCWEALQLSLPKALRLWPLTKSNLSSRRRTGATAGVVERWDRVSRMAGIMVVWVIRPHMESVNALWISRTAS